MIKSIKEKLREVLNKGKVNKGYEDISYTLGHWRIHIVYWTIGISVNLGSEGLGTVFYSRYADMDEFKRAID